MITLDIPINIDAQLRLLDKLKIDYKDPTNFIYIYNDKIINDYMNIDSTYKYREILELYLVCYYKERIQYDNYHHQITSFPIYPNMTYCKLSDGQLTTFEIQPNMKECYLHFNQLTTFSIQPNMKECNLSNNQLTAFSIQPNMKECYLSNNRLTTFSIQPNMKECYLSNNRLTTFSIQPNMKKCNLSDNKLTTFPVQPNMTNCDISDNELTTFPRQPVMKECKIKNNNLINFSFQPKMIKCEGDQNICLNNSEILSDNIQVPPSTRRSRRLSTPVLPFNRRNTQSQNIPLSTRRSRRLSTQAQNIPPSILEDHNNNNFINSESNISEEDSDDFTNVITSDSDSLTDDISSCPNNDIITLEPYDINLSDVFTIYYLNSMKKFSTGSCISKSQMKDYIKSEDDEFPSLLSTIWKGGDKTGVGGKPTCKFIIKMPPNNIWITLGSFDKMMNSSEKKWYLLPLYSNKRRRIGYKYGISANHGQIPGSYIYKSFTKEEIMDNIVVKETDYDFPLYVKDLTLSELDSGKMIIKSIKDHFINS